jgi:transcriptional regulator with XRE-family HTH domain
MSVGEKIKHLRESMNLTQTELGDRLGVKKNAVSKWECGRVEDIPTSKIKAMANLFGVKASYLIEDEEPKKEVSDDDIQFALFGGKDEITEKMYEEVKNFAAYVKQRENYGK